VYNPPNFSSNKKPTSSYACFKLLFNSFPACSRIFSALCSFLNSLIFAFWSCLDTRFKLRLTKFFCSSILTTFATYCLFIFTNSLMSCIHLPTTSDMCIMPSALYSSSLHQAAYGVILWTVTKTNSAVLGKPFLITNQSP